jgi:hypothetical protein
MNEVNVRENNEVLDNSPDDKTKCKNYSEILFSFMPVDLSVDDCLIDKLKKQGVDTIYANRSDFNKVLNEQLNLKIDPVLSENYFRFQREFKVPFGTSSRRAHSNGNPSNDKCPKCSGKIAYINGSHQYLSSSLHLYNYTGWLHTKDQYMCSSCDHYIVFVQRKYVFTNSGYNFVIISKSMTNASENKDNSASHPLKKIKTEYTIPESICGWFKYGNDSSRTPLRWNGICIACKTETLPQEEHLFGALTGRMALIFDCICPNCYLVYHVQIHDY